MAIKYARLFDPVNQFVRKDGIPNSGGSISVFYEGTDDRAELRDEDGTVLNNPLTLDADGRALGTFVDAARVYRLEVDDAYGAEQFTVRKMVPCGGSAGSALGKEYKVVSTDGTVTVVPYVDAGVVTFDLSTNYGLEGSRWGGKLCLREEISEADVWQEIQTVSSNGNIAYSGGWYPGHAGAFDLAASVEMAEGVPGALNTVEIMCSLFVGGVQVETQYGIIDPSLPRDRVSFGFKGYALEDEKVDCKFYAKSSAAFSVGLAGRAFYNDEVDGIIGGGGGNPGYSAGEGIDISTANVISVTGMLPGSASSQFAPSGNYAYASSLSGKLDASASSQFAPSGDYAYNSSLSSKLDATASSMLQPSGDYAYNSSISSFVDSAYVESSVSGKMDASAMTAYQPSGDYAYSSALSSKLDATASSQFAPSGNYQSALTFGYDGTAISSIDGSSLAGMGGHEYSGVYPVVVDNTAETVAVDSTGLSIDSTLSAYQSGDEVVIGVNAGMFAPSGDYAYNSSISSFVDSAYVESAVSGKQDASAMTAYQQSGDYAYNSSLSSKLDATASSMFAPSGDYAYESAVSSKLDASASSQFQPSGDYAYESSVSSKLDASASGEFYLTSNPSAFVDSAYVEGQVSGKLDATAASGFYTTANESGFVDSAYVESQVSGKQDELTFAYDADLAISSINGSALAGGGAGFPVEINTGTTAMASLTTGFQDDNNRRPALILSSNPTKTAYPRVLIQDNRLSQAATFLADSFELYTGANVKVFRMDAGSVSGKGYFVLNSWYVSGSGGWRYGSSENNQLTSVYSSVSSASSTWDSVTGKLDSSASSSFYTTANESSFVDSAYVESAVSGKQDVSGMTAYQDVAGMTAYQPAGNYQPSGDYIYASALGILEV